MATRDRFRTDDDGPPKKKRKTGKGRKSTQHLEVVAPNATLEGLPDNIILSIMTLLDLRSLVLVSRVCRRFHHLYLDESIWISVDLTRDSVGSKIDSRILKNIIRTHLPTSLREIKLSSNAPSHASKNPVITVSLLDLLFAKCPRIERLTLEKCDLTTFPADCLLYRCETLEHVTLTQCVTNLRWLQNVRPSWPHLSHLSLEKSVMVTDDDLKYIGSCVEWQTTLRSLNLRGCYRIRGGGVRSMGEPLAALRLLDVRDCFFRLEEPLATSKQLKHVSKVLRTYS